MRSALIGYTGFVGGNLKKQFSFDDLYNSKNIEEIKGKKYDLIVSAGANADRGVANANPEDDWSGIKRLLENLSKTRASLFVLISTIDIYPDKNKVDEDTVINLKDLSEAYGRNRYKMEIEIRKIFPNVLVVRLPNLIGEGLKKNFVFDLIHETGLEKRHKESELQFYNLKNVMKDIQIAMDNELSLINFAVEPTGTREIAKFTLGLDFQNVPNRPPYKFDFRTKHGNLYGSKDGYLYHKGEILMELKKFIENEKKKLKR